ncbi:MAG: helix-turn-helix domain-containing protein [Clostridium sp.]
MKKLLKAYKVEIKPTTKQIHKINQSIGVCRWLYNASLNLRDAKIYKIA